MIYTFRFEKSGARRMNGKAQEFIWREIWKEKLHQGWGESGMSLLDTN